jgi:DNA polymerase I
LNYNKNIKLTLQIHDDLMFEVKDSYLEEATERIPKLLQESLVLKEVDFFIGSKIGKDWGSMSKI